MGHDIVKDEKEQKRQFLDSCSEAAAGGVPGGLHGAALLFICNLGKIVDVIIILLRSK